MATPSSWLRGISQSSRTLVSAPPSTACSLMPGAGALGAGNASVTFNSGTLNVSAVRPRGILAWVDGNGSATATTGAGTVINVSGTQFGAPESMSFRAHGHRAERVNCERGIAYHECRTGDHRSPNLPVGIRATNSGTDAPIFVTYTGPGITTVGGNGAGITGSFRQRQHQCEFLRADHDERLRQALPAIRCRYERRWHRSRRQRAVHGGDVERSRRKAMNRTVSGPPRRPAPCRSMRPMCPPRESSAPASTRPAAGRDGQRRARRVGDGRLAG